MQTAIKAVENENVTLTTPGLLLMAGIQLTDTGCRVPEETSWEDWKKGLQGFKWMLGKVKLGFADYQKFGRKKFGDEAVNEQLEQLSFDLHLVTDAMDISTIPEEMRYPNLTSDHYKILARSGLKDAAKATWAKTASEGGLSPIQLKASIARGTVTPSTSVAKAQSHGVVTIQGIAQEFQLWLKRLGGNGEILKMPLEEQMEIAKEIRQIAATYACIMNEPAKPTRKPRGTKPAKKAAKPKK